jgi:thiol:disulfide interchange protein
LIARLASALAALALALPLPARAVDPSDLLPIEQAFALRAEAVAPDRIALTWAIAEGYYLYRHRTEVRDGQGFAPGALELPPGIAYHDEFFGDVETYRGELRAVLTGTPVPGASQATLRVRYQGCADIGVCYPPHTQTITVALAPAPAGAEDGLAALNRALGVGAPLTGTAPDGSSVDLPLPPEQAFRFEAIAASPSALLLRFTPAPGYYLYRDRLAFRVIEGDGVALGEPRWPAAQAHHDDHFGDVSVYFAETEVPLPLGRSRGEAQALLLEATFQGCQTDGVCYPPMTRQVRVDLPAGAVATLPDAPARAPAGATTLALALLLALGGGLILNLMPCVLPVLSLKALSLADGGHGNGHAGRRALWYTAGVLASFVAVGLSVLGLRAAGESLGWGFQLQQPLVVAVLAYVMLAIGLSLSGVFSLGLGLSGMGQTLTEKKGPAGDFFTGVLAVVVASPCTAPFMGTALAFAFAAPPLLALLVFLALGLGLALPFLLIGFVPALARRLPQPGAWMETFKQALAFPMYLTAAWLAWVLAKQRGADAIGLLLAGAVLLALALWWLERLRFRRRPLARALALATLALALLPLWGVQRLPATPGTATQAADDAVPYSAERLAALRRDNRLVFVNMTADWCVTCKVNERRVLGGDAFRNALAAADGVYMKGDWTNVDPDITAFIESHGAVGVPLYVVYPRNGGEPRVLPTVLSDGIVQAALEAAK